MQMDDTVPDISEDLVKSQVIRGAAATCRQSLKKCMNIPRLMIDRWAENRLVDFDLWSAGAGVFADGRLSLDERLVLKPDIRKGVINLINLLKFFVDNCQEKAKEHDDKTIRTENWNPADKLDEEKKSDDDEDRSDPSLSPDELEAKKDVEVILNQIIRLTVAIRKAGSDARFRRADKFFNLQDPEIQNFKSLLELIMHPKGLKQKDQLNTIQLRLIEANLRRRHRFFYAKKHSRKLAGQESDSQAKIAVENHTISKPSPNTGTGVPSNVFPETQEYSAPGVVESGLAGPAPSVVAPASATAASAIEGTVVVNAQRPARAAATVLSRTTSKITYPRPPPISLHNKVFKCPCCCQSLPISFTEHSQWKKHLASDISPYTCILLDCAQPFRFYLTRKDWENHINTEHGQSWNCFVCKQLGEFAEFHEETSITHHLRTIHGDTVDIDEIPMFVSASQCSKLLTETIVCPLCPGSGSDEDIINHIAQCVHDFSLRSLPLPLETDKKEDYFADDSEKSNSQNTVSSSLIEERDVKGLPELDYDSGQTVDSRYNQLTESFLKSISQSSPERASILVQGWISSLTTEDIAKVEVSDNEYPVEHQGTDNNHGLHWGVQAAALSSSSPGDNTIPTVPNTTTGDPVRHRIIVGLDYGTSYSGISIIPSSKNGIKDIMHLNAWAGNKTSGTVTAPKTPSRIAYASQNPLLQENQWGYGVDAGMTQCAWIKLLLDENSPSTPFDDTDLKSEIEKGRTSLPPDKTVEDVASDYLKELYNHIMRNLEAKMGGVLDVTEIRFWLAKPATWSDEAETKLLSAAKTAGFGSRPNIKDEICLILEPEAAALATISLIRDSSGSVKSGDSIIICDCGGGTVDLASYIIEAIKPKLSLRETCPTSGGKCGGISVDLQLRNWMVKRYGDGYARINEKHKGPGSEFMNAFERNKMIFGTGRQLIPMSLPMDHDNDEYYDETFEVVLLDGDIMKELFEPVIKNIKSLVQKQIDSVREGALKQVNKLLLVGGFGNSAYLQTELERHLRPQGITVHVPDLGGWSAVAEGAVLRGLEAASVDIRKSRRSYGTIVHVDYVEGVHDPSARYINEFGRMLVPNCMNWAIKKGTEITDKTRISIPLEMVYYLNRSREIRTDLHYCDDDVPPEWNGDSVKKLGCIVADLSAVDFTAFQKIQTSYGAAVRLTYEIIIILGGEQGIVYFQVGIAGNIVGTTEIEFAKETTT
ncbi:hypothetical protein TWF281_011413 [Arthrobotrys megalospora]